MKANHSQTNRSFNQVNQSDNHMIRLTEVQLRHQVTLTYETLTSSPEERDHISNIL